MIFVSVFLYLCVGWPILVYGYGYGFGYGLGCRVIWMNVDQMWAFFGDFVSDRDFYGIFGFGLCFKRGLLGEFV